MTDHDDVFNRVFDKKPKPTHYTTKEGGEWISWKWWAGTIGPPPNAQTVHSIKFDDGSIFDTVNGWRPTEPPPSPLWPLYRALLEVARKYEGGEQRTLLTRLAGQLREEMKKP